MEPYEQVETNDLEIKQNHIVTITTNVIHM
jgi:hypothetical protein